MRNQRLWMSQWNMILLLALTVFLLAGMDGQSLAGVPAPKTIKIGCSIPLTGMFGAGGNG